MQAKKFPARLSGEQKMNESAKGVVEILNGALGRTECTLIWGDYKLICYILTLLDLS